MEAIQEALAEAVVVAYLKAGFAARSESIGVSTSVKAGDCVRVIRTGGTLTDIVVGNPLVTTESYSDTSARAEEIAALTGALLTAMAGTIQSGVPIYAVRAASGIASLPDPTTSRARYTQTHAIGMRAAAI